MMIELQKANLLVLILLIVPISFSWYGMCVVFNFNVDLQLIGGIIYGAVMMFLAMISLPIIDVN